MIKQIDIGNLAEATELIKRVFLIYEAPDYEPEGVDEFMKFLNNKEELSTLTFWGEYIENKLVGVIATRSNGSHISLFFVDEKQQGKGIGRRLFNHVWNISPTSMTVKASPYALDIYRHLGFEPTDDIQCVSGIKYIPMTKQKDTD